MDPEKAIEKLKEWNDTCDTVLGPSKDAGVMPNKHLMQSYEELMDFCAVVEKLTPKAICLEIGMYRGGTHFLWAQYFSRVISLEVNPEFCKEARQVMNACNIQKNVTSAIINACAHSPQGREEVTTILENMPVDMLFIDGDHTYESSKADFESHHARVREGGIIAFHDAGSPQHMPGVYQAIEEIEQNRDQYGLGEKNLTFHNYAGIAWFVKQGQNI